MQKQQLDEYRMALPLRYLGMAITILEFVVAVAVVICVITDRGTAAVIAGAGLSTGVLCDMILRYFFGGKYLWYYLDSAGKLEWTVSSGEAEGIDFSQVCSEQMLRVPLFGCFRGPAVIQSRHFSLENHPWRIHRAGWFSSEPQHLQVWLIDRDGSRVILPVDVALSIIERTQRWGVVPHLWFNDRYHLGRYEPLARVLFELLKVTVSKIDGTKQFIKSKQAQEIRKWLVQQLQKLDPDWYPKVRPKA